MRKKVTIEDISRLTGLSRGTISRALNNRPDISESTRQKVLAACRKLHYVPSFAARSLATGRQLAVVVLVPAAELGGLGPFLAALARYAAERQYVTLVSVLPPDRRELAARVDQIPTERADAVIVAGPIPPGSAAPLRKRLGGMPCVLCGDDGQLPGDVIAPDIAEAGRLAVRTLPRTVRSAVCLIRSDPRHQRFADAACQAGAGRGLEVRPETLRGSHEALGRTLAEAEAVICGDDELAGLAMGWLFGAGREVGKDVLVIGLGDTPLCELLPVPLTSIDPDLPQVARRAFDTLRARIEKTRRDAPSRVLVPPKLAVRSSCPAA